ncbi:MAG: hypothetical protein AAGB12_03395 [Pseudomonadota bacterium]
MMSIKMVFVFFALFLIFNVSAGDIRVYPASTCSIADSNEEYTVSTLGYISNNSTTDSLTLVCPVARDSLGGNTLTDAKVYAIDASNTDDISCALYVTVPAGNTGGGSLKRTTGSSFDAQILTFNNRTSIGPDETVYYQCRLPPKSGGSSASRITSYSIATD